MSFSEETYMLLCSSMNDDNIFYKEFDKSNSYIIICALPPFVVIIFYIIPKNCDRNFKISINR